jgi:hypothetical protein
MSLLSYTLQPGQFGEIWSEPVVAVGAVGWECSPSEPLDEAVDGETGVEGFQSKKEVNETRRLVSMLILGDGLKNSLQVDQQRNSRIGSQHTQRSRITL